MNRHYAAVFPVYGAIMRIRNSYEKAIMEARAKFLQLDFIAIRNLQEVFAEAAVDVHTQLRAFEIRFGAPIRRKRLGAIAEQLDILARGITADVEAVILDGANLAASIGKQGQVNATRALLSGYSPEVIGRSVAMFATVNTEAVATTLARSFNGKVFADSIWEIEQGIRKTLAQTVAKGIAQGKSAFNLAKDVEPFLLMDSRSWSRYKREVDEIAQGVRGRRSRISFEAKRLARTEINHAYREANFIAADRAPWVTGVRWVLSGSHVIPDICDIWATQDIHNLGSGVYPPLETPIDHPNGLCYTTNELVPIAELPRIIDQIAA